MQEGFCLAELSSGKRRTRARTAARSVFYVRCVYLCVCPCLPQTWAASLDSVSQGTSPGRLGKGCAPPTLGELPDEILR